jgi:hypothetical protein
MSAVNLRVANNVTFRFLRDLSNFAADYPIAEGVIRMQARLSPSDPVPIYEWSSANVSGGVVAFDPATNLAVFAAPARDMAALQGPFVYDARLELPGGVCVPLFSGRLVMTAGVTRAATDASTTGVAGLLDTVSIDGVATMAPAVVQPAQILLGVGAPLAAPTAGQSFHYDTAGRVFYRAVSGAWAIVVPAAAPDLIGLLFDLSVSGNFWLI